MGFFDFIKKAASKIGHKIGGFKKVFKPVGHAFKSAFKSVKHSATNINKKVFKPIGHGVSSAFKRVAHTGDVVLTAGENAIKGAGNAASGIGNFLSGKFAIPLMLGVGGLVAVSYLNK